MSENQIYAIIKYSIYDKAYTEKQAKSIKNYFNTKNETPTDIIKYEPTYQDSNIDIMPYIKDIVAGSTIVVYNLSVFGRYTHKIYETIQKILDKGLIIESIKDKYVLSKNDKLTNFILAISKRIVDMEKELSSLRTKEALYQKKLSGTKLGKPKGVIQKSKFDKDIEKIKRLLKDGVSIRKISTILGYNNHIGLNNYINKRDIKKLI